MEGNPFPRIYFFGSLILSGLTAALTGAGAAFLGVEFATIGNPPADSWLLSVAAALAAGLIGPLCWWLCCLRPRRFTVFRGSTVGVVGSVIAHPLTWFLTNLLAHLSGMRAAGMGNLVHPPLADLGYYLLLTVEGLVFVGWLTTLLGGILGGGFTWAYHSCARVRDTRR